MKLLIFDIDGTLTDTKFIDDQSFTQAFNEQFRTHIGNIDWENCQHATDSGLLAELYYTFFGTGISPEQRSAFQQCFFQYLDKGFAANPAHFNEIKGAARFIHTCISMPDIRIAFATGSWKYSAELKLRSAAIPFHDYPLATSDRFVARKDIVQDAINQSKQLYGQEGFDSIIYFGDGKWDLLTTAEMNIPLVGIDARGDRRLSQLAVPYVFRDFEDAASIFAAISMMQQ